MGETRDYQIITNVEYTVYTNVCDIVREDKEKSLSNYVRKLIIEDLVNRGRLSEKDIKEIFMR